MDQERSDDDFSADQFYQKGLRIMHKETTERAQWLAERDNDELIFWEEALLEGKLKREELKKAMLTFKGGREIVNSGSKE